MILSHVSKNKPFETVGVELILSDEKKIQLGNVGKSDFPNQPKKIKRIRLSEVKSDCGEKYRQVQFIDDQN